MRVKSMVELMRNTYLKYIGEGWQCSAFYTVVKQYR